MVDHHTLGTGTDVAKFIFGFEKSPESIALAKRFPTDPIMRDPGYPGTMEYALVNAGIPAMTTELGGGRGLHPEMVTMGVDGNANVLCHHGIIDAAMRLTASDAAALFGGDLETARAGTGGYLTTLVKLNRA